MTQDFRRSVHYNKRKKQAKCRAGGYESVRISAIARVCNSGSIFQSFLCAFLRGMPLVCNGRVSIIARFRRARVDCTLKNATFAYFFIYYDD